VAVADQTLEEVQERYKAERARALALSRDIELERRESKKLADAVEAAEKRADAADGLKADLKAANADLAACRREGDALRTRLDRAKRAEAALAAIREALS
jgi:hypothetical protein